MFRWCSPGLCFRLIVFSVMLAEDISLWQQHSSVTQMRGGPYGEWKAALICGERCFLKWQRVFSPPSPSMKMINGMAHKVNSTREIAFYLWGTYLSPAVVNLSSWDPVPRQRRRVQTPPSLPRPCAKVLTSKTLVTFFLKAPQNLSLCYER